MKQCKECGKDFEPKNLKGVFCSVPCKQKDYRKNKNKEFQDYKKAVETMSKDKQPPDQLPNTEQTHIVSKSKIVRSMSWYIDQIKALCFEDEYKTMNEMILSDGFLTDEQKKSLILSMKTSNI